MSSKLFYILVAATVLVLWVTAIYLFPFMPDQLAIHWNAQGGVDGYGGKFIGLFLIPILALVFGVLFEVLPKIDPLKQNVSDFRREYNLMVFSILLLLAYFYLLSIVWNLGWQFNFSRFAAPAIGILFLLIGSILPRTKRNWFLGIRTPWTLSSDYVWKETHRIGGALFIIAGIFSSISGILFPAQSFFIVIAFVVLAVVWSLVYSYVLFRQEGKTSK
ncbi:MAG: hypothetical protein A2664_03785 [Candidatus Taylorbacteria bacterium RIFCSPHIGHO2_01_FULL_46_22b]|uniref:DUF1648 domain-containing protein n=1 Tax=Candidatus Taylorbacteria bacterium RIFCSPHIGHO2_01_FULL_46_22b TaxID=1802301 RepID=A0A1G2M1G4_9BACT|nr:MAG: hypothetical protein A2664_03785 [Candidatus Taylorbacteria bacterium RIFCSPHIGHO2_01_FULL_46_22b]